MASVLIIDEKGGKGQVGKGLISGEEEDGYGDKEKPLPGDLGWNTRSERPAIKGNMLMNFKIDNRT